LLAKDVFYKQLVVLRWGDYFVKVKRFNDAILAYESYIHQYPTHSYIPYVYYQLGMIYYIQMLSPDRDSDRARKASNLFKFLMSEYPNDIWTQKAHPRLNEAFNRLIQHDLLIAKYYFCKKEYKSAINRFKLVLTEYPDVGYYNDAIEGIRLSQDALISNN